MSSMQGFLEKLEKMQASAKIFRTLKEAQLVADTCNSDDEEWTYKVTGLFHGYAILIYDETDALLGYL